MSQENVEIVKAAIDAVNREDWDAAFQDAAPGGGFTSHSWTEEQTMRHPTELREWAAAPFERAAADWARPCGRVSLVVGGVKQ
jgi:hypothetical protein